MMCVFFFFNQKTAYGIWYGLVGWEMCIRDSCSKGASPAQLDFGWPGQGEGQQLLLAAEMRRGFACATIGPADHHAGRLVWDAGDQNGESGVAPASDLEAHHVI